MERRECIRINNKEQERADCNTYLPSRSVIPTAPRNTAKTFAHPQSVCSPVLPWQHNTTPSSLVITGLNNSGPSSGFTWQQHLKYSCPCTESSVRILSGSLQLLGYRGVHIVLPCTPLYCLPVPQAHSLGKAMFLFHSFFGNLSYKLLSSLMWKHYLSSCSVHGTAYSI